MTKYKRWTSEETNWLINNYSISTMIKCINNLNKTYEQIQDKANKLKLLKCHKWTDIEIQWLKDNYPLKGKEFCANYLNVSEMQIHGQVCNLGLSLNKETRSLLAQTKNIQNKSKEYIKFGNDFENFVSPEHVYLLGFLFADGYLVNDSKKKSRNRIVMNIAKSDGDNIKHIFEKTGKWNIKNLKRQRKNWKDLISFNISNYILRQFLEKHEYSSNNYGSPNKLLSLIPKNLIHFWYLGF